MVRTLPSIQDALGSGADFDGPDSDDVRRFFIENALYWLETFHIDVLRLDAIHGIFDASAFPFLAELSKEVTLSPADRANHFSGRGERFERYGGPAFALRGRIGHAIAWSAISIIPCMHCSPANIQDTTRISAAFSIWRRR